jgi:hypothetical protein
MKRVLFVTTLFILLSLTSFSQRRTAQEGKYSYETECLGVELDGTQTLRVWGTGRNRKDAVEQAKKNAVREVLFKGIRGGECEMKPLVPEVNAEEKYESYFNKFFKDDGLYKFFVTLKDERIPNRIFRETKVSSNTVTIPVVVRVQRPQLKEQMKQDGILESNY